jgi:hypothetical protein
MILVAFHALQENGATKLFPKTLMHLSVFHVLPENIHLELARGSTAVGFVLWGEVYWQQEQVVLYGS